MEHYGEVAKLLYYICISRFNSSSWVHGRLFNLIKLSVAAGSNHDRYLTLEYTREDWLPIHTVDARTIGIKKVLPSDSVVLSSNVPHPTRDLMVITIGEDMVFRLTVKIPVSTNANFTVNFAAISPHKIEGIAGHVTQVGRNIKSLDRQIEGTGKCTSTCENAITCI